MDGELPIRTATRVNNVEAFNYLLRGRPEHILQPDVEGDLPIHIAAQYNCVEIFKNIFYRRPYLLNRYNTRGELPLHVAVASDSVNILRFILTKIGNMFHKKTTDGMDPLIVAIDYSSFKSLTFLLSKGKDIFMHQTLSDVLQYAIRCQLNVTYIDLIISTAAGDHTDKRKILQSTFTRNGDTLLHVAVRLIPKESANIVQYFADADESALYMQNAEGYTPILLAIEIGSRFLIQLLLAKTRRK